MKGLNKTITDITDGNISMQLVEWRQHDQLDYEVILVVDGNPISIRTHDIPRVVRLMRDVLGCAVTRLEELITDEVLSPA